MRSESTVPLDDHDGVLSELVQALKTGDEARVLQCLQGWTDAPVIAPETAAFLRQACLRDYSSELRVALLFFLYGADEEALRDTVTALLRTESDLNVRCAALQIAAYLSGDEMTELVSAMQIDAQPTIRATATAALAVMRPRTIERDGLVLQALDREKDPVARERMVLSAASLDGPQVQGMLWRILRDSAEAPQVAVEALRLLRPDGEDTGAFVARLGTVLAELRARSASADLIQAVESKLRVPEPGFPPRSRSGCVAGPEGN
ncbi:MAG: hypothetical protein HYY16_19135 [Planctomycetes bacterium]|nr:hypothetical protein [Planctomycetota bacterium]